MKSIILNRKFIIFLIKFLFFYFIFYCGTLVIIGLSAPVGYYSHFVSKYLNYVSAIRSSLLYSSKFVLNIFGYPTYLANQYNLKLVSGRGIVIVYECVGYGVMSFWSAFIVASSGSFKKKLLWWFCGITLFWLLNIIRLCILLVATNKGWKMPLGWDHHTWFNIAAYCAMLGLIYFFDKRANLQPSSFQKYEN